MDTFEADIAEWARKVQGAERLIFQESAQELVSQLSALVPVDTGALRASLQASTTVMPLMTKDEGPIVPDFGEITLVIAGVEIGQTLFLGYTMSYGAFVHFGANGRPGRPWVSMVAQRWPSIVSEVAMRVRHRLGL